MTKHIYLDTGATTKIDSKVIEAMQPYLSEKYGNASSSHSKGEEAKEALETSRKTIAKALNAKPEEIIFTSGGTESNNIAIKSIAFTNRNKGNHIITTKIEHDCILESCRWLEKQGFNVTYLDVNKEGFVRPEDLENAITDKHRNPNISSHCNSDNSTNCNKTILVSIIHGNNEIGTIQNLEALGNICKKHNVYFHTDACQSFTKTNINVRKINIDLITLNAHKIYGPKGVGALFIKKGTNIETWQHGGGHELGLRAGTENIPAIVGFAKAVEITNKKHIIHMINLRNKLINNLLKIPNSKLNGPRENRLCNNVNICFKGIDAPSLGDYLNKKGISSSLASACSANNDALSHVLNAIGLSNEDANSSLRLTISRETTEEEIEIVSKIITQVISKWRKPGFLGKVFSKV